MNSSLRAKTLNSRLIEIYADNNIPLLDTVPRRIQVIPTLRCNYRCTMCFQSEEVHLSENEIDFAIFEKMRDVFPFVKTVYFTGGEPLMYSEFNRTLDFLAQFGISLTISTNGSLLTGKRLQACAQYMDDVKISLDAATPETYASIRRNGDFDKVVRNILELQKMKIRNQGRGPSLSFSMVAMKKNIAELPDLVSLVHSLGGEKLRVAHASMHTTQVEMPDESLHFHKEESDHFMIEAVKRADDLGVNLITPSLFSPQKPSQDSPKMKTFDTGRCIEPWEYMLINQDGKTALCCSNCVGKGDLNTQTFDEIWNDPFAQKLRRQLNTDNEPAACASCFSHKRTLNKETELPDQYKNQASA